MSFIFMVPQFTSRFVPVAVRVHVLVVAWRIKSSDHTEQMSKMAAAFMVAGADGPCTENVEHPRAAAAASTAAAAAAHRH